MYSTAADRVELARQSWEQAAALVKSLRRKLDRLQRNDQRTTAYVDYGLVAGEIELVEAQLAALRTIEQTRWDQYFALTLEHCNRAA
jgi:hypothetical protein